MRKLFEIRSRLYEMVTIVFLLFKDDEGTDSMDRSDYPSMEESFREIKPNNQLITVSILI